MAEKVEHAVDRGTELIDTAQAFIREKPLAAFGIAFASGWLIAKLIRR